MNKKIKIGSNELLNISQELLEELINLLKNIQKKIHENKKDGLAIAFSLLLSGIIDSSHTVLMLSKNNKLRDCYILSRSIFEHVINIGYFSVKGEETVEKAYNHTLQKSYRDLRREIKIKDVGVFFGLANLDGIVMNDRLKKSLEEFSSKKGLEIRAWTGDSIFKKVELISEKFGNDIGTVITGALFFIYRHSSEFIHGTLFSMLYAMGLTQMRPEWPKNNNEFKKYDDHRLCVIIQSICLLLSVSVTFINDHIEMKDELNKTKILISNYRKKIQ
jgi:hypothetical protein